MKRTGTRLTLGGENYRYSGPNVEWLGIEAYGPDDALDPRYPSHLEVDDALDTAKMMSAPQWEEHQSGFAGLLPSPGYLLSFPRGL